jgi:hypothetical protein
VASICFLVWVVLFYSGEFGIFLHMCTDADLVRVIGPLTLLESVS